MFKKKDTISIKVTKETPPLTLDQKWHELFAKKKTLQISQLEKKLNQLIQEQGRLNNEYKEYGLLKKKLMGDIISQMPEAFETTQDHALNDMDKNKHYIQDINKKLSHHEKRLSQLPQDIQKANTQLAEACMLVCYKDMVASKKVLKNVDVEINELRDKLKGLISIKTENKEQYELLYSYMHDLVGPEAMERFDLKFMGEKQDD